MISILLITFKVLCMKNLYNIFREVLIISILISLSCLPVFSQNLKAEIADSVLTIGSGTKSCNYPFTTFWTAGRTQMLYTSDEIVSAGGSPGTIKKIGFDVRTNDSIPMNEFYISMRNISQNEIESWVTDSLTECYSGMYEVRGTGWQTIFLHHPFNYDGRNLLVEICYTNSGSSNFSPVSGTNMPGQILTYYADGMTGCTMPAIFQVTARPDIRIIESTTLGIPHDEMPGNLQIFPNPADGIIKLKSKIILNEVTMINITGQIVFRATDNHSSELEISTSDFPPGIYLVKATTTKGIGMVKINIRH